MEPLYFGISLTGAWSTLAAIGRPSNGYALLIAVLTPVVFIYARYEMRNRRLLIIRDFLTSFPATAVGTEPNVGGKASVNPSLEFVRSKYVQDLSFKPADQKEFEALSPADQINMIIARVRFAGWADLRLLIASIGMMIVTYYGADALLRGIGATVSVSAVSDDTSEAGQRLRELSLIGGLAFAGAYLAAIRGYMRGLAVFDLSAFTFIRYTVESIVSVVFILAIYRAFPDPTLGISLLPQTPDPQGSQVPATLPDISRIWLILAPVLGYLPDSASKFALLRLQSLLSWVKMDDDRFNKITRITPLDALDGIDYATRFRLQECGIYDVQGLATYNPIMLHIESPYGIYQAVDWIAQAQLCHLVGIEKFLVLREMQIRTIFDLERAIDFRQSNTVQCHRREPPPPAAVGNIAQNGGGNAPQGPGDINANMPVPNTPAAPAGEGQGEQQGGEPERLTTDSPEEFDLLLAGILVAPTQNLRDICTISGLKLLTIQGDKAAPAESPDAFCLWFREKLGVTPETVKQKVEHMMGWIADDLHVRRLRRIWQEISASLGEQSKRLDGDTGPIVSKT
jgi:hypothetical protein